MFLLADTTTTTTTDNNKKTTKKARKGACPHGHRLKSTCFLCGGSALCRPHGNFKPGCAECRAAETAKRLLRVCAEHGKRKDRCTACRPDKCAHGQFMLRECRECGRGRYCKHGTRKHMCASCGG